MKIYLSLASVLMGSIALSQQYIGNVGINTEQPTNTLHVKSNADPLRIEGLQTSKEGSSLLVTTPEGVVKKVGGKTLQEVFAIPIDSGADEITGTTMGEKNNTYVNILFNNPKVAFTDTLNGYDASTGEYTVQEEGFYYLDGVIRLIIDGRSEGHIISPDGRAIRMNVGFKVKSNNKEYLVGDDDKVITRGLYIPDSTEKSINNVSIYIFKPNGSVWLRKGDVVTIRYNTYGGIDPITDSDDGDKNPDKAFLYLTRSFYSIYKVL